MQTPLVLDDIDNRLNQLFPGRVVRKDLVRQTKSGFNVPVYVLEYLLGQYCSSTDPEIIAEGLEHVRNSLSRNYVRADESEKIKAITRQRGRHRIIDKVKASLDTKADRFWAELTNMGVKDVLIDDAVVHEYDKLLMGGIWAIMDISYDPEMQIGGIPRPFAIERIKPIQQASTEFSDFAEKRSQFTRDEWLDVIMRSIGIEPNHKDFAHRQKMLLLLRLIPMAEANYNLTELGPRGTGKSFVYREISPFSILISGGQTTVAQLFMNLASGRVGLVGLWDVVAFDEVAGIRFKDPGAVQILKDYMESGSFSRGKEEIPANASMVFNGNIDGDITLILKTSNLFQPMPEQMQNMALIDRLHYYLPGWEIPKAKPGHFTEHYGFIVDYITEVWRQQRKTSYADVVNRFFSLGSHLNQRDVRAVQKTVSGYLKLLHPDGNFTQEEVSEYLEYALEGRRRVKEQLKKMGGLEYWAVNFSYIAHETRVETFVTVPEQTAGGLIPADKLEPGVAFTIGTDRADGRRAIFRIEAQASKGKGKLNITGAPSQAMRDAIKTAKTYLQANATHLGVNKDPNEYDFYIQIVNLMQSKEGSETGVAFLIVMLSAMLGRPVVESLVILGEMSIHGALLRVDHLAERLQLAMDNGAKRVLLPAENKRDFVDIPTDLLDKVQIIFYSDPITATFRAMDLT